MFRVFPSPRYEPPSFVMRRLSSLRTESYSLRTERRSLRAVVVHCEPLSLSRTDCPSLRAVFSLRTVYVCYVPIVTCRAYVPIVHVVSVSRRREPSRVPCRIWVSSGRDRDQRDPWHAFQGHSDRGMEHVAISGKYADAKAPLRPQPMCCTLARDAKAP